LFAVAKRSPILGYNHNIRHRGVVFHVQTEDSGVANPHIYTHLFHGGVIITTRKLVYDAEADESVVKALMQAQHKAIMKELKAGAFDEKISSYLVDNPDLLPAAGAAPSPAGVAESVAESDSAPAASAPPAPAVEEPVAAAPGKPLFPEPTDDRSVPVPAAPPVEEPVEKPAAAALGKPLFPEPTDEPDTERFPRIPDAVEWRESDAGDRPFLRAGRDVSAAIDAIFEDEETDGTPSEITDDVASIHSSAPPSAPPPPGLRKETRPGSYLQARRPARAQSPPAAPRVSFRKPGGKSASTAARHDRAARTPSQEDVGRAPTQEKVARTSTRESLGRAPTQEKVARTSTRESLGRAPTQEKVARTSTRESLGRAPTQEKVSRTPTQEGGRRVSTAARATPRAGESHSGPPPVPGKRIRAQTVERVARPSASRRADGVPTAEQDRGSSRQRAKTARGVVVSRPAVIVGAPPQVVGGKVGAQRRAPRVRKAQAEEKGESLFGKGLISEKSLDEVILAYLSDDTSEE